MDIKKIARVQKILSLILLVCFFFPFFSVSCGGEDITITGLDTVKGLNLMGEKEEGNPICIILLLLPLLIFLAIKLSNTIKKAFLLSAILGLADYASLMVVKSGITKAVNKEAQGLVKVNNKFGYSVSLIISLAIIALGVYGIYKLKDNSNEIKDEREEEGAEYCKNCGSLLLKNDQFCTKCGCSRGKARNEPRPSSPAPAQIEDIPVNVDIIGGDGTQIIDTDDRTQIVIKKTVVTLMIRQEGEETNKKISDFPCIVGRSPEMAAICIPDMSISRKHLSLDLVDGKVMVQDLNSSNGVEINGNKIQPEDLVMVKVNDVIKVGKAEIEIVDIK